MAKETYEVGPLPVFDHAPGTQFEADLKPVQRARLLKSGALKRVTPPSKATGEKPAAPKGGESAVPAGGMKKE